MINDCPFTRFADTLEAFIRESLSGSPPHPGGPATLDDGQFNRLALSLLEMQCQHNAPYRQFCRRRGASPDAVEDWTRIPSVPTAAFKELELTSLPPAERTTVFHSSGTTDQRPSRHFHNCLSLKLYEASLLPWLQTHLLPEALSPLHPLRPILPPPPPWATSPASLPAFLCLTPPPALAPHSSLAHMFDAACRAFGDARSRFVGVTGPGGAWQLDLAATFDALDRAASDCRPLLLLGTAFSFVHLLDVLAERHRHYALPAGSRVLETGGYKGRARTLPKADLHALITEHLGIAPASIVSEYGMSELSSQAYDGVAGEAEQSPIANHQSPMANGRSSIVHRPSSIRRRVFRFPPWARVRIVSPETGHEVDEGETGLIRIFDLANAWSVMAVQTADLGIRRGDGFELIGRVPQAEPRGCSLMAAA